MMLFEVLSLGGFTLSLAGFAAALEEQSPRLGKTRWWCVLLTGSLLSIGLVGHVPDWMMLLNCVGFLISLQAIVLACFADHDAVDDESEPAWWPEFERDFRNYIREMAQGKEAT